MVDGLRIPRLGLEKTRWHRRSMDEIDDLQAEHSTLAIILRARRAVPMQGMSFGVRYLQIPFCLPPLREELTDYKDRRNEQKIITLKNVIWRR